MNAPTMEHTACIGQPFVESVFQFIVVVGLCDSKLGSGTLNTRTPSFPNLLQGVFGWTKSEETQPPPTYRITNTLSGSVQPVK